MQILQTATIVVFFATCLLLVVLILLQAGKGGSLGILGGGGSSTPFGASTVDVIAQATWWLAAAFFALSILAAIAFADSGPDLQQLELESGAETIEREISPEEGAPTTEDSKETERQ